MKNNKQFKLRIYTREKDENNNDICDIHLISHNEVNLIQLNNIKKSNTNSNFKYSNYKNYNNNENNKKILSNQLSRKKLIDNESNKLLKNKISELKKQIKTNNFEMDKKSKQYLLKINTLKEINKKLLKDYNNNQNDLERIDELNGEFALLKNKLCQLNEKINEKEQLIKNFDEQFKKDKINLENNIKTDEEKINDFYNKIFEDFDNNKILFDVNIDTENFNIEIMKIIFFNIIKFNYNKIEIFIEKLFNNENINFDNFFDDFLNLLNVKNNNIKNNDINFIKMFLLNYFYLNKNLNIKYISYEKLKEKLIEEFNSCKYNIKNINKNEIKNIFQNDYNIDSIIETIKNKYDKENKNTIFIINLINILYESNENSTLFLNKNLFSFFIYTILDYEKNIYKERKNINYFILNYQELFENIQNI